MLRKLAIEDFDNLPHGSGIDCNWFVEDKGSYFKCTNSYYCMNENGMYCGFADFTLIVYKQPYDFNARYNSKFNFVPKWNYDFKLHFNGAYSQYLNQRYCLREYLEETFDFFLSEIKDSQKEE